jgi:hypothetical protein
MAFTVTKSWSASPYDKGLGVNTPLGTGFLRRVSVVFDGGTTTGNITAADLGASAILDVVSIIMKSTQTVFAGTVTSAVIPLTATNNCTVEVLALVRGL